MARRLALTAALVAVLLPVSGSAGGSAQTPKRGGTVVVGPEREPACLNRVLQLCYGTSAFIWITDKVYPPAFLLAPDLTRRPELVSRVPYTQRRPFTLTYHIRAAARWSDGVPITARDFVFTLRMIRKYGHEGLREQHSAVRSLRVVDEKTLRVVLRPRFAGWRSLFPNVLPFHALRGESFSAMWTDRIVNPKTGRLIGSGPFLVESFKRGSHLTLVRNPNYWGRPSRLDRIIVRFCREACAGEERLAALRQGAVDLALLPPTNVEELRRTLPGMTVRPYRQFFWEHLALNLSPKGHAALRDDRRSNKLVRRALAYAINRNAIARDVFGAIERRYEPSHSAVFLPTDRRYVPNWKGYDYDPDRSRLLLERAGCRRDPGDGIFSCHGERLSLRVVLAAGVVTRARAVELMGEQLRRAGIELRPSFIPNPVLIPQIIPAGEFDLAYFAFVGDFSTGHKSIYGCGAPSNFTGYCQRLVTRDLDSADRILDDRRRGVVLNRVDRQLAKDVPVIPLFQPLSALVFRKDIRNVVPSPDVVLWNAEDWWLAR